MVTVELLPIESRPIRSAPNTGELRAFQRPKSITDNDAVFACQRNDIGNRSKRGQRDASIRNSRNSSLTFAPPLCA